jgi:hypothetical protein
MSRVCEAGESTNVFGITVYGRELISKEEAFPECWALRSKPSANILIEGSCVITKPALTSPYRTFVKSWFCNALALGTLFEFTWLSLSFVTYQVEIVISGIISL